MFRSVILITLIPAMFACGQTTKSSTPAPQTLAPTKQEPIVYQTPAPAPQSDAPRSPEPEPIPAEETPPVVVGNDGGCQQQGGVIVASPAGCVGNTPVVTGPVVAGPVVVAAPIFTAGNPQRCYRVSPYICELENAVIGHINGFRNASGLPGFFPDFQLAFSAREWSYQQAMNGIPALSPLPQRLAVMAAEFPVINFPLLAAENIAGADSTPVPDVATNAKVLFDFLMSDPAAANNIVGPNVAAGVGIVQRGGRFFLTILFAN